MENTYLNLALEAGSWSKKGSVVKVTLIKKKKKTQIEVKISHSNNSE